MGPILTFDKSFLQMLSPDEVDELDLHFEISVSPILVSEIVADLRHPSPRPGRLPNDMVRALARKMVSNHGIMQAHWRKLALGELSGLMSFPMVGTIIVDSSAPNVMRSKDGHGVIYDSRQDREMWSLWSAGNFSKTDEYLATRWREQIAQIDVSYIAEFWTSFCAKLLPNARSIADVIAGIDKLISKPSESKNLLSMIYHFTEAPRDICNLSIALADAGLLPTVRAWAPYCASVARLSMVLCCCLAMKFVTSRPTNVLDLQYLFYSPFVMVFVSNDKLHRDLWPATTTQASFVWGDELKEDLQRYLQARQECSKAREDGGPLTSYTEQFTCQESVIARLHEKHLIQPQGSRSSTPPGKFEDLPEEVKRNFREASELIDEQDAARGTHRRPEE